MISIKLSYEGELRRAAISRSCFTYDSLTNFAMRLFPVLNNERKISFSWIDDDGDKITMSSNEELLEALRIGCGDNSGLLRFEVNQNHDDAYDAPKISPESPATKSASTALHKGVSCDECYISPIVGIRYKCTIRHDYDLCESCEAKRVQPYPMIKCYAPYPAFSPPFHGVHHFPPPPPPHEFNSYDNPMHGPINGHHAPWHHHRHGPRPGRCHGRGFGRGFRPCRDIPPRECSFRHEPFEEAKSHCKTFNVPEFIDVEALKKFCTDAFASSKSVDTEALKKKLSEMISKVLDRMVQFRHPVSTTPSQQQPAASTESDVERVMFETAVRESMEELERSMTLSSTTTSTSTSTASSSSSSGTDTSTSTSHDHIAFCYGTEESKSAEETRSEIETLPVTVGESMDSVSFLTASATRATSIATTATALASVETEDTRSTSGSTSSSTNAGMEFQLPLDWEFVNMNRSSSPPTPPYNQMRMPFASINPVPAEAVPVAAPPVVPVASPLNEMEVWREELRILADMGFVDPISVIPLLNEHAFPAFSQQPAESASIEEEGIQRVVNALLSGV